MQSMKNDKNIILKQYEIFVKSSENISLKRMSTNKFYVGLNTILFVIASYTTILLNNFATIILSTIGILLCIVWISNISSYKKLNSAKFKVIHKLEEQLPEKPFTNEDLYLKGNYELTKIEKVIPLLFIVSYLLIISILIWSFLIGGLI